MADDVGKVSLGIELDQSDLNKQMSGVTKGVGARFTRAIRSSMKSVMKGAQASAKAMPTMPAPKMDPAAKAEMEHLTAVLDNVNARLDSQRRKLSGLRETYRHTFSDVQKNKLQEDILKTEAAILRLTKQSDNTSQKIWKLEDSFNAASKATVRTDKPIKRLDKNLGRLNKRMDTTTKRNRSMGRSFQSTAKQIIRQALVFTLAYKAIRTFQRF